MNNVSREILKKFQGKFFESDNVFIRIIKVWNVVGKTIYTYSDVIYKITDNDIQFNRNWVLSSAYMAGYHYKRITKSEFEAAARKGNYKERKEEYLFKLYKENEHR